jgi:phosphoribosylaminoimidazole-succinocarboxamide synthase
MSLAVTSVNVPGLEVFRRGKVRDTFRVPRSEDGEWARFAVGGDQLLMVATDRLSAFDVILPTPIPGKGIVLTQLADFWFKKTSDLVPNHLVSIDLEDFPAVARAHHELVAGRTMLVNKAERIEIECVVRGYLAGSGWSDYQRTGEVCGISLPPGMRESERFPEPIFTPAIKNDVGHDINISVSKMEGIIGRDMTRELVDLSCKVYNFAASYASSRGIIIADTKFEFGMINGRLTLIDEILTPDSSRFWEASQYAPGRTQPSLDKQYVRDWLATSGWNKEPPGPELPLNIIAGTQARYLLAYERLTGQKLDLTRYNIFVLDPEL